MQTDIYWSTDSHAAFLIVIALPKIFKPSIGILQKKCHSSQESEETIRFATDFLFLRSDIERPNIMEKGKGGRI